MNLKMSPKTKYELKKNAPTLFSIVGVIGVFVTGALGIVSGIKAERIRDGEELSKKEFLKRTWKCYVWTILSAIVSSGCIVAGNRLSVKQIMALSGLAAAGSAKFNEYRGKIRELIGGEKEDEIFKEAKESAKVSSLSESDLFQEKLVTSGVELETPVRYYDDISHRYFNIPPTKFLIALYDLNRSYAINNYATLNFWYECLGVDPLTYREFGIDGDNIGWSYDYLICNDTLPTWIDIYADTALPGNLSGIPEGTKIIRYDVFPSGGALDGYYSIDE